MAAGGTDKVGAARRSEAVGVLIKDEDVYKQYEVLENDGPEEANASATLRHTHFVGATRSILLSAIPQR